MICAQEVGWMDGSGRTVQRRRTARGVRNGDWKLSPLHVALNGQRASVTGVLAYKRDAATLPPPPLLQVPD